MLSAGCGGKTVGSWQWAVGSWELAVVWFGAKMGGHFVALYGDIFVIKGSDYYFHVEFITAQQFLLFKCVNRVFNEIFK